jgi:hypothetical protein
MFAHGLKRYEIYIYTTFILTFFKLFDMKDKRTLLRLLAMFEQRNSKFPFIFRTGKVNDAY